MSVPVVVHSRITMSVSDLGGTFLGPVLSESVTLVKATPSLRALLLSAVLDKSSESLSGSLDASFTLSGVPPSLQSDFDLLATAFTADTLSALPAL